MIAPALPKEPAVNIRLPIVLFDQSLSLLPAAAEIAVPTQTTTVSQPGSAALEARPPAVKGATLAQITSTKCCKRAERHLWLPRRQDRLLRQQTKLASGVYVSWE